MHLGSKLCAFGCRKRYFCLVLQAPIDLATDVNTHDADPYITDSWGKGSMRGRGRGGISRCNGNCQHLKGPTQELAVKKKAVF